MKAAKTFSQLRAECGLSCRQDNRGGSTKRGYGSRWQKARERFFKENPLCVECRQEGRTEPAVVADHIEPHKGDKKLFWDRKNWQGLCKQHHDHKTAKQDGGFGNGNRQYK